ncbi:MAG: RNA polymerase sigma factor [Eubacteriales bacterium]|nr:RNA polymerase sigma factor [Eubacteriales bacterium]
MIIEKSTVDGYICGFRDGNRDDFDALYRYTREFLYMYALSVVKDRFAADDAVQDAFIRVYRYAEKYKPGTNALAWLIEITKNAAINAKNDRGAVVIVDKSSRAEKAIEGPERAAADADYMEYMLKKLSAGERQVVTVHLYGDCTLKETAEILGIPATTAEWRYKSALKKLKRALEADKL